LVRTHRRAAKAVIAFECFGINSAMFQRVTRKNFPRISSGRVLGVQSGGHRCAHIVNSRKQQLGRVILLRLNDVSAAHAVAVRRSPAELPQLLHLRLHVAVGTACQVCKTRDQAALALLQLRDHGARLVALAPQLLRVLCICLVNTALRL
jgi:hypothetical protein